jgi:hypothetical protein
MARVTRVYPEGGESTAVNFNSASAMSESVTPQAYAKDVSERMSYEYSNHVPWCLEEDAA